jgi:hypothetical protein
VTIENKYYTHEMSIKDAIPTEDEYCKEKISDWAVFEMGWTFHVTIGNKLYTHEISPKDPTTNGTRNGCIADPCGHLCYSLPVSIVMTKTIEL